MINRNNYEEYLLMYLDDELSSQDRQSVELFIAVNPDLKQELELLQQTILHPEEHIEFAAKRSLYRKEDGISLNNYQEYFLLYIDNELNVAEKESVETFVLQNPDLQEEFTLLKQTVLPTEKIVFTAKETLYREEEKRRPVIISLRWASLAAAAMIALIALVMFNNGEPDVIAVNPEKGKSKINTPVPDQQQIQPTVEEQNTVIAFEVEKNSVDISTKSPRKQQQVQMPVDEPVIAYEQKTNEGQHLIAVIEPPLVNSSKTDDITTTTVTEPGESKVIAAVADDATDNNYAQHAVYTEELLTEDDKNLQIGSLQINTDKVRGFFRKATRFLSNKIKDKEDNDDGKIRIANMEVKKSL